ncbi:MAG: hypothetical protein WKG01_30945 [Kofleriaceae bacterium]
MRIKFPLALLVAIPACVDSSTSEPKDDDLVVALAQDNGGFTTDDEAAQFAADDLYADAAIEADRAYSDPMALDPSVVEMNGRPEVAAHNVLVMWGRIPADPDATTPRRWDGELRLSRGGMIVRRTIAFEDRTDRVLPRTTRDAVSFESATLPRTDGFALTVLDPTPAASTALSLTYTPADGGAAHTLDLSQLEAGAVIVDLGDGNKLIAIGRPRNDACDHGFMRGRWHQLNANLGTFLGVVGNGDGELAGHVRGIYGERRSGDQVVFGKFIDREGRFRGLIGGTYEGGRFDARWLTRAGDHGVIHGAYFPGASLRAGGFVARWAETTCAP